VKHRRWQKLQFLNVKERTNEVRSCQMPRTFLVKNVIIMVLLTASVLVITKVLFTEVKVNIET